MKKNIIKNLSKQKKNLNKKKVKLKSKAKTWNKLNLNNYIKRDNILKN